MGTKFIFVSHTKTSYIVLFCFCLQLAATVSINESLTLKWCAAKEEDRTLNKNLEATAGKVDVPIEFFSFAEENRTHLTIL